MVRPGDALVHATSGQRLIFRRTAAQTAGRLLEFEVFYPDSERPPPAHVHPDQEQQVELLAGSVQAELSGRIQVLRVGDVLLIPAAEPHAVWNPGNSVAHAVWYTFPAGTTESDLEASWLAEPLPAAGDL